MRHAVTLPGILHAIAVLALLVGPAGAAAASKESVAPEAATGRTAAKGGTAHRYMVAAANPLAASTAQAVLSQGGGAMDAAVAAQMVLNLVEPQSSGIGGGAFLLYWDATNETLYAYDGRETAPAAATESLFLQPDGTPMGFWDAVVGGRAVGVPGVLRMLELAHKAHGTWPWAKLFQPAIALAETGFAVSPRLHALIAADKYLARNPAARRYFYDADGAPLAVGAKRDNPAFAAVLRAVADGGADAFYTGDIARNIVAAVTHHPDNPGLLSEADMAGYKAVARAPVCAPYRAWRVCGMPPPTSGGLTVLQILGILAHFDLPAYQPGSARAVHLIAEASRLAFADRGRYMADADFVAVPVRGLLDPAYLAARAALIDSGRSMGTATAGEPPRRDAALAAEPRADEGRSTTHFVIVDAAGNAVSMTSSIESAFGARLMVRGFLLNNELTDFSFRPAVDGRPVANRVAPGKRPRSSMSPTVVFDADGRPALLIGSPGGSRIIGYVVQALVTALDWGVALPQAIAWPHFVNRNGATDLEAGTAAVLLKGPLERLGEDVKVRELNSGLHGIFIDRRGGGQRLVGGADPRREGVVLGE